MQQQDCWTPAYHCSKRWHAQGLGGRDLLLVLSDSGKLSVLLFSTVLNR